MVTPKIEAAEFDSQGYKVQVLRGKGDLEGPNIIYLHPAGQPPAGTTEYILNLAQAGQVFAPNMFDLISALQHRGVKNPSFADIVNEFSDLDLLNKRGRTGLVATSFGASFAWEYTVQKPQEVDWIVAASATGWPLNRSLHRWAYEFIKMMAIHQFNVPKEVKKKDPGGEQFLNQIKKEWKGVWQGLRLAMNADDRQLLPDIQIPVDLLWAEQDTMIPVWSGREMEKVLPNARLEIVSQHHHMWYTYEPEKVTNRAVQRASILK